MEKKLTEDMTWDNIHIDHIKPVSRFNLDLEEEFNKCCHYTNLQPLLAKDNLNKSNKWTHKDELFWNKHIIYKNYDRTYISFTRDEDEDNEKEYNPIYFIRHQKKYSKLHKEFKSIMSIITP